MRLHEGSALPWLYGVATNVCRNASRSRRPQLRAVARLPVPTSEPDHADRVSDRLASEARMQGVLVQLQALPAREREVVGLVAWAGLSYEQAAAALDVPVGTVRSRLFHAMRGLRAALDAEARPAAREVAR